MGLTPAGTSTPRLRFKRRPVPGSSRGGSWLAAGVAKEVYGRGVKQTLEVMKRTGLGEDFVFFLFGEEGEKK